MTELRAEAARNTKRIMYMVATILATLLTISLTYMLMSVWPLNPIEIKSVKILNPNNVVCIGDDILFQVHFIKHTDKCGRVVRQLINDRVINYTPHISSVPKEEDKGVGTLKTGPSDMPGRYQVSYTVIYEYFGFRKVSTSAVSDEFILRKDNCNVKH